MAGLEGRTLDRYQLQQLIGRGGMADVYMAYDTHFERQVAVKVFKREDEDLLRRFVREAHMMASLRNPHLIPVYDSGTSQLDGTNYYYIVMPMMDGGTLRALIKRAPLSLQTACRYMRDIADALDYIHRQGIIHRDIKASNVLLDDEGRCYLSDFGIARAMTDSSQMTGTGNVLGTVDYMAPELFEVHQRAAPSSDHYALGVLLFEMVTGRVPFSGENQIAVVTMHVSKAPPLPSSIVASIPPMVDQVILRALEKQPALRYSSASELAEAFCQATTMPQVQGARVTNPMWGTAQTRIVGASDVAQGETRHEPQPVLLPPGQRSTEVPRATGQFAVGSYMPSNVDQYDNGMRSYNAQAAYPDPLASPARKQARIVTVLAIIALVAILAPVGYVFYTQTHQNNLTGGPIPTATTAQLPSTSAPTPNMTATGQAAASTATQQAQSNTTATAVAAGTATVQAQASATQQAQSASATAVAAPTVTAQAMATATVTAAQAAISGQAIYSDPLNNPASAGTTAAKWDQGDNCIFQGDGYHVTTSPLVTPLNGCHEANKSYQNFALTVNVAIKKGATGGVFFRMQANSLAFGAYSGYLFEIDNAGRYRISRSDSFNSGQTAIQDWTASSALKTGGALNKLQIVARDSSLVFFINGTLVTAPPTDTTYLRAGNIGFLATVTDNGTADVVYSNLNVYQ